jgi:hypothetical protein
VSITTARVHSSRKLCHTIDSDPSAQRSANTLLHLIPHALSKVFALHCAIVHEST